MAKMEGLSAELEPGCAAALKRTGIQDIVRRCLGCQFFSKQQHVPAQALRTIPPSWPFACWGLDSVGPLKAAQGGYTHIFVTIDKFTKWIEVKPVSST